MGGSGAILAASMEPRIRALVSSAAFADPVTLTKNYMRLYHIPRGPIFHMVCYFINRWLATDMTEIAPKNRISRITVPTLLIHGDADRVISPNNMKLLHSQAQQEYVKAWLIPGGLHHSTIIRYPEYGSKIVIFFNEHLCNEEGQYVNIPTLHHDEELLRQYAPDSY